MLPLKDQIKWWLPVSLKKLIKSQILNIFNQFEVDAIKIGLLTDIEVAKLIRDFITLNSIDCPVVIDPIFKSTTGTMFYKKISKNFWNFSQLNLFLHLIMMKLIYWSGK